MWSAKARCRRIQEIAFARGKQAFNPVVQVQFEEIAADDAPRGFPLPDGKRRSPNIVRRAEMRADAATLGAKLLQLARRQEVEHTPVDGAGFRLGW